MLRAGSRLVGPAILALLLAVVSCTAPRDPDPEVWVNTTSGVYHCRGSRFYEGTAEGRLAPESVARAKGYRPADGERCGDGAPQAPGDSVVAAADTSGLPEIPGPRVWLNTASGIYHCPGSRYFQATADGELMPESSAKAAGHRPAGGRSCS